MHYEKQQQLSMGVAMFIMAICLVIVMFMCN